MSIKTESLGFFGLTVSLGTFVEVIGGKTQLEVSQRKYVTKPAASQDLLKRIMNELGAAIGDASATIDLRIENSKAIVDVVEKTRPVAQVLAAAAPLGGGLQAARRAPKRKSRPKKRPSTTGRKQERTKRKRKSRKS
jgi:hypothetical protein